MNKPALKTFAVYARKKLKDDIIRQLGLMGITAKGNQAPTVQALDMAGYEYTPGKVNKLFGMTVKARAKLAEQSTRDGFAQLVEEAAYTWFNRLIAIRFMEVNDYLPTRVRVLSSTTGSVTPDIVIDALNVNLGLTDAEREQVLEWKEHNNADELFRLMLIKQCEQLATILPNLFTGYKPHDRYSQYEGNIVGYDGFTDDPMKYLLHVSCIDPDGVVAKLVALGEDDFDVKQGGQVEIIGWLYQYYNSELKDETFALLKQNVKITKERIPAATQLFTPDWIVRYIVENSLGRLWLEHCQVSSGLDNTFMNASYFDWKYYMDEALQEPAVAEKLRELRAPLANLNPEEITLIDPCMGSGHILVYAFNVLMTIYTSCGYDPRDAAIAIVHKNLWGLDIDRRACQLSYFALMMKARQYNRHAFELIEYTHLYTIQDSATLTEPMIQRLAANDLNWKRDLQTLKMDFADAGEHGSILKPSPVDIDALWARLHEEEFHYDQNMVDRLLQQQMAEVLPPLLGQHMALTKKYDVVVTNPPYMGSGGMGAKLSEFVKSNYPDSKSDLFAVFMERCGAMCKQNGFQAMITQHAWMFLSSFEALRHKLIAGRRFASMAHLGARAFDEIGGEVVQTTAFVLDGQPITGYKGSYARLIDYKSENEKRDMYLAEQNRFSAQQENFEKLPGLPIAYWVSSRIVALYRYGLIRDNYCAKEGIGTRNDEEFLRNFWEVKDVQISRNSRWVLTDKAGMQRKWYLGYSYIMDWEDDGYRIKNYKNEDGSQRSRPQNIQFQFKPAISWGKVGTGATSFRYREGIGAFNDAAPSLFGEKLRLLLAVLNSKLLVNLLKIRGDTINVTCGVIEELPLLGLNSDCEKVVDDICEHNITISRSDWDSFETSWDFNVHPMVIRALKRTCSDSTSSEVNYTLSDMFESWQIDCNDRFAQLKANEEELNRIFIDLYGLQDELTPDVAEKDVTVYQIIDEPTAEQRAMRYVLNRRDAMVTFVSYAVGCMFGRYSLDVEGRAYAGGDWDTGKYSTFPADRDNVLPITDEEYFEDDIVTGFCDFVKTVYGSQTLETNLDFIAAALDNKGDTAREVIRAYFVNNFYKDHLKTYQKRPIYWLFDSGKKNGFKALMYMHRYDEGTVARVRVDYLLKLRAMYESAVTMCESVLASEAPAADKARAAKRRDKLTSQLSETREYDLAIAHVAAKRIAIDLDEGVKRNYALFQGVAVGSESGKTRAVDLLGKLE